MNRWMIRIYCVCALLQGFRLSAGEKGFQFLRVGVTARGAALGEAYTSQFGDVTTYLYNPANIALLTQRQAAVGYMNHVMDIGSGYIAYAQPTAKYGVLGGGILYFNYGDFQGYDAFGNETSTFHASDFSLNLFHADQFRENFYYGANLKFIHSSIEDYNSSALAMDLGMIYEYKPMLAAVGMSVQNLGFTTDAYVKKKEPLPLSLQIGASKKLEKAPIVVSVNWSDLNLAGSIGDRIKRFAVGAEFNPKENLFIRAGYNHQRRTELDLSSDRTLDRLAGFTAGIGFTYQRYRFDYAFASWGIGVLNRFSISANF